MKSKSMNAMKANAATKKFVIEVENDLRFSKARVRTSKLSFTRIEFIIRTKYEFDSSQSKQNLIVLTIKSWLMLVWVQNLFQFIIFEIYYQ
jgi:hypothetical protein